jgi:hypothetical protein
MASRTVNKITGPGGGGSMTDAQIVSAVNSEVGHSNWQKYGLSIATKTGVSESTEVSDIDKYVELVNANPITLAVEPNSAQAIPVGTVLYYQQSGVGQVTITAGAGVTVNGADNLTRTQFSSFALTKTNTDVWTLSGDLTS